MALTIIAGFIIFYSTRIAPGWLRVSRLTIRVNDLRPEWEGLRIAHLSDFHLGAPGMTTSHLHLARSTAEQFAPDLIALTGDYYESGANVPSEGLYSDWPAGVPVLAVLGNHDRRGQGSLERISAELRAGGATILNNEACEIELRGQQAWICGVDDPHTFNDDVAKALEGVPNGETALLFLSHSPAIIDNLRPGDAHILLVGHTHGGQVRTLPSGAVPFVDAIRKVRGLVERQDGPVYRRWHRMNGTILIISDGLGISTLPARFRSRPHLILIELAASQADESEACDDVSRFVREERNESWLERVLT